MATTPTLRTRLSAEAQANNANGGAWSTTEAAVESILDAIASVDGVTAPATTANPGSDASKAAAVQGVTGGKPIHIIADAGTAIIGKVASAQYTGVPSSFAIQTADQTVFTLAAGEVGFIQNLSADAPLAVKFGASASTTSLNLVLKASTAASDGTGGSIRITDWVGVVSVAKMTGTASYLAWKQAP